MSQEIIKDAERRMAQAIEATQRDLATIRTGRANAGILDHVMVSAYGAEMPVNQVATITIPESRQILITPFDKSVMPAIEKGIQKSDLGLNPNNDGNSIRLNIPPMTEDRRKEFVKQTHGFIEQGRVSIRNVRRDANDQLQKARKANDLSEDEQKREQEQIQKLTDRYVADLDEIQKAKEAELMEV